MNTPHDTSTRHAKVRMQQRAIPPLIVSWLLDYGSRQPAAGHAALVFFDKASRRRLAEEIGSLTASRLAPLLDAYVVEGPDGRVVTTGWRTARVLRELSPCSRTIKKGQRHVQ